MDNALEEKNNLELKAELEDTDPVKKEISIEESRAFENNIEITDKDEEGQKETGLIGEIMEEIIEED